VLGHIQRGGTPSSYSDRVLSTRFAGKRWSFVLENVSVSCEPESTDVVAVPIQEGVGTLKTVDMKLYDVAKNIFD